MAADSKEGPVRARPLGPSAMSEEEAEVYPEGRTTGTVMRVKTLLVRVARAVLSGEEQGREGRSGQSEVSTRSISSLSSSELTGNRKS